MIARSDPPTPVARYPKLRVRKEYSFARSLLGLPTDDPTRLRLLVDGGLPYASVERLQSALGLSDRGMARLLSINDRTLPRRRREGKLDSLESDRLLRTAKIISAAIDLLDGDKADAYDWLSEPHELLDGAKPIDIIQSDIGAKQVMDLIHSMEHDFCA